MHKQVRGKHLGLVDRNIPCLNLRTLLADMNQTSVSITHTVLVWYRPRSQKNWRTTSQVYSTNHIWRKISDEKL